MRALIKQFSSPMLSLFLLTIGASLITTAQSVILTDRHYPSFVIGLITAANYFGFVYAAFRAESFIVRVGHIRAYAYFAALIAVVTIIQGLFVNPWLWFLLRLIAGYCSAGLFIVIESWLLNKSSESIRGRVLGFYMLIYYGAQAIGQMFLHLGIEDVLRLFVFATLTSVLSIVPLAMTWLVSPQIEKPSTLNLRALYRLSPSGVIGCLFSGLLIGPIYGLLPVFIVNYVGDNYVARLMMLTILGGMIFQYPLGKLSDRLDRRFVILLAFFIALLVALALLYFQLSLWSITLSLFVIGGMCFAVYPLSMSHACDVLANDDMVAAAQGLVLANSFGMIIGPLIASLAMNIVSPRLGLFGYMAFICLLMTVFFAWRQYVGKKVPSHAQQDFVVLPRATPGVVEIDPRIEDAATNTEDKL